jgi:hypothetical protein
MSITNILEAIDSHLATLQAARAALLNGKPTKKPVGRPAKAATKPVVKAKRKLSPEGRAKIIAAVKKRWAAQKKAQKVVKAAA